VRQSGAHQAHSQGPHVGQDLRNLQQQGAMTRQPGPGQFMLREILTE
jgi:hypothetical protein